MLGLDVCWTGAVSSSVNVLMIHRWENPPPKKISWFTLLHFCNCAQTRCLWCQCEHEWLFVIYVALWRIGDSFRVYLPWPQKGPNRRKWMDGKLIIKSDWISSLTPPWLEFSPPVEEGATSPKRKTLPGVPHPHHLATHNTGQLGFLATGIVRRNTTHTRGKFSHQCTSPFLHSWTYKHSSAHTCVHKSWKKGGGAFESGMAFWHSH